MKRFWKEVGVAPAETGFQVLLDGRTVRTPAKAILCLPTQDLADAVAKEWAAQADKVRPADMPLTGFANAALDLMHQRRGEIVDTIAGFAETDLLCYRAEAPTELRAKQAAEWQPLLDWAAETVGARLVATEGIVPVIQDAEALGAIRAQVNTADSWALTGLNVLTQCLGSVVLALAVVEARLGADEAFRLSQLDELWQESQWGQDPEAAQNRAALKQQVSDAGAFVMLSRV